MNATENRKHDYHSTANQRILDQLVRREVGHCVSSLVYHFTQHPEAMDGSDYDYDELLQLCSHQDYSTPVEEFCRDMDREACVEYLEGLCIQCYDSESLETLQEAVWQNAQEEGVEEFASEHEIEPYDEEAYEHWIVSGWFAERLKAQGEMTGELFGLTIWGRTCTGQAIHLDYCIGRIAEEMEILDGQRHSWKDKD